MTQVCSDRLSGALEKLATSLQKGPVSETAASSPWRLVVTCTIPFACGVFLVREAAYYFQAIPPGDGGFRTLLVTTCMLLAAGAMALVLATVWRHGRQVVQVDRDQLVIHRFSTRRCYNWADISVGFPRGLAGFRRLTISTPDGPAVMDEMLYPSFDEAWRALSLRISAYRRSQGGRWANAS